MSYLNVPRLHFAGRFQADPSTINNRDANFDPTAQPRPSWNAYGTHNWVFVDCSIRSVVSNTGHVIGAGGDPLVGATVASAGQYPAKLVDLDPDNQGISQIWGLVVEVAIPDPGDPTQTLASVTGTMVAAAFGDLWGRAQGPGGMPYMGAYFQQVLTGLVWSNEAASTILSALRAISPDSLSIKFNVDSIQTDPNQENFTFGRLVGTIGPAFDADAPRSAPRRLVQPTSSAAWAFGPVACDYDRNRNVVVLDLGNAAPTDGTAPATGPSVPIAGWPVVPRHLRLQVTAASPSLSDLKSGLATMAAPFTLGFLNFDTSTYLDQAGIIEIAVPDGTPDLLSNPLELVDATTGASVCPEDQEGRYVDIDIPFFRLNPGEYAPFTLWATKFGQPWVGADLDLAVSPPSSAGPWQNGDPAGALTISQTPVGGGASPLVLTTGGAGTATGYLQASDPGMPRKFPSGQDGPDGQIYAVSGSWVAWGQVLSDSPINVLVFSGYPMPARPTWTGHVEPIFSGYARMYPYMTGILDLSDYATVADSIGSIQYVLNLPPGNPHHMPVVRDLSRDKLAMINAWITSGHPEA